MKNQPSLNYYGDHSLNFEDNDIDDLEYYAISELRKLAIPDEIIQMEYYALLLHFPGGDLSKILKIKNWCPISFVIPGACKFPKVHAVLIGPLAMRMVFTPNHIILPSTIYEPAEWYSPNNKEKVQAWRSYFYAVISHFGGDHALYVEEREADKYYKSALGAFEQTLVSQYGAAKKSMFDYPHGKFPKYYIDNFADLKEKQEKIA